MRIRHLSHGDPVKSALAAQLRQIRVNSAKVLKGPAAEPLHKLRVAALRAGFALNFFRKYLNVDEAAGLRDKLARARKVMARKRDWDIFSVRVNKDLRAVKLPASSRSKIFTAVRLRRAKAQRNLVDMIRSRRFKKMLAGLKDAVSARNKKSLKAGSLIAGTLKGLDPGREPLRAEDLHNIRIAFKKLRYACEFLADFYDHTQIQELIRDIIDVQDVLGEYRDGENTVSVWDRLEVTIRTREMDSLKELERVRARAARKKFGKMWAGKRYRRVLEAFS